MQISYYNMAISNFKHPYFEELKALRAEVPQNIEVCESNEIEKYPQETKIVLESLDLIEEGWGLSMLTDESRISDFNLTEKELNFLSGTLGFKVKDDQLIFLISKKIHDNKK